MLSWGIVQLVDILQDEGVGLGQHAVITALLLAVVGLPIVIAVSWIYELTPQGFRATMAAVSGSEPDGWVAPGDESAAAAKTALAAVAVLPFEKLTPSTPHAYMADALPIELQSLLSRVHELRVVSRQSSVARAGAGDLRTIARDLNIQYVISGSIAELGDRLKINVQLDDAVEDKLLWSDRYDVAATDIESVQREISEKVVGTFGGERMRAEIKRANAAAASAGNAWELVQKARGYLLDYTPSSIAAAIPLLRKAVELDPKYAVGYATLGLVTAEKTLNGISANLGSDRRFAVEVINRAEQLAPHDPVVLRAAGCVHAYTGDYRRSLELLRRAVKLAPFDLGTWGYLGWPLVAGGKPEHLEEVHQIVARLLNTAPRHPGRMYWQFHESVAYTCEGDDARALALAEEYTAEQPRFSLGWLHYANVLGRLRRHDDARTALDRSLGHNPLMTPAFYAELMAVLSDQPGVVERRVDGLRSAGLLASAKAG